MFHSHQGQTPDLRAHPQGHGGPRGGTPSTDPPAPTGQRPVRDAPRVSTVRLTSFSLSLSLSLSRTFLSQVNALF